MSSFIYGYTSNKSIISVSLGTGIHGYKHNDIAKQVVERLDYLSKRYDIDFTID